MDGKELLKHFKAGAWGGTQAVEAFAAEAGVIGPEDLLRVLALLGSRGLPGDTNAHKLRHVAFARLAERSPHKDLFVPYVRALKTADSQLASVLAPLIPKVNNVAGHAELCALLKAPEAHVRRVANHVLKQIGGTTVFKTLTDYCGEKDFAGRMEAMDILMTIGRHHAIPALGGALAVGSVAEKVQALVYLGDPEAMAKDVPGAVKAISVALKDGTERVAMQAIGAFTAMSDEEAFFAHIGPALDSSSLNAVKAAVGALRKYSSPRAIEALERKLRMGPSAIRLEALATLEGIGTDTVLPAVVGALNHKQIAVRTRAGEVMTNLALGGNVDLARTLLWLLRSRDVNVRRMAVDIAKKVGDPSGELAPKLLRFLRDEDWWVRERVMDALVVMAGKQLTRHLVGYLQDPSDVVRRYAVDALQRVKDPASVGALVRAAQGDADWWVRERAIEALAILNDQRTVPYIIDLMKREPDLQRACLEALRDMKARSAAPDVAALLAHADPDLRLQVVSCLSEMDDSAQAEALSPLQQDPDHRVRAAVKELLTRWQMSTTQQIAVAAAKVLGVLERLLVALAQADGDDLILAGDQRPYMKRLGRVVPLASTVFSAEQVRTLLTAQLTAKQLADLADLKDVDFSFEVKSEGLRFRANVFHQLSGLSGVFRIVKDRIPVLEQLGLPPAVHKFGDLKNGLILVGGPTGSGKSTTLAGIIDHVNRTSARHIVTLEDPIEVIHAQKKCLVNQREIGTHTQSFQSALRATLREDPDVILVGEMRDLATIQFAVTAAETGHLVFGTLHTVSVDTSVDRLINAFPPGQQPTVRSMLADTLRAVMCQYLLKKKDGGGRVLAVEVLINNDAIANLIRKGKTFQIPSVIATQRDMGMQSMDSDLERLFKEGTISAEEAYMKAANKKNFEWMVEPPKGESKDKERERSGAVAAPAPTGTGAVSGATAASSAGGGS